MDKSASGMLPITPCHGSRRQLLEFFNSYVETDDGFTGTHRSLIQNRVEMRKTADKLQTQTVQDLTGFHFLAYISFLQNGGGERVASEETRV